MAVTEPRRGTTVQPRTRPVNPPVNQPPREATGQGQVTKPPNGNGLEPALNKGIKELLFDVPKRFVLLVSKLISFKTAVLILFSYLYIAKDMDVWALVFIAGLAIFGREFLKYIKDLRK